MAPVLPRLLLGRHTEARLSIVALGGCSMALMVWGCPMREDGVTLGSFMCTLPLLGPLLPAAKP
jgi:hypothetical protein